MNSNSTSPMPTGCNAQTARLEQFASVSELQPHAIVAFFRSDPAAAIRILTHSYDKRYTPSTFLEETDGGFCVGWFDGTRQHVQHFSELPEAATDYLLFSFGKGRLRC